MIQLTGHYTVKKQLSDYIKNSHIGHAYIFDGIDGIGKTTAAKWFAAAALCQSGNGIPCGVCNSCRQISVGSHPDVIEATQDFVNQSKLLSQLKRLPATRPIAANSIYAMRIVRNIAATLPFSGDRKFIIIPDADQLNLPAQNAILKVFEEPPLYLTIIMISNNSGLLLPTIKSRAVMVRFQPLSDSETFEVIKERCDKSMVSELVNLSFGSPGTALSMSENPELIDESKNIRKQFFDYVFSHGDMTAILPLITKDNISFALSSIAQEALLRSKTDLEHSVNYINIFDIIQDIRLRLKSNSNFTLTVSDMLIRSWEELHG